MRVVVVGAGPAGLAAAGAAARQGASVLLVDAEPSAGGQYHRGEHIEVPQGVEHLADTTVWALEGTRLHLRTGPADAPDRVARVVDADTLVLATGAHDRALPFPGWDLPGVVTAGGAQAMAKAHGVTIGKRVVVAGTGPFLLPVADFMCRLHVQVVEVLEAGSPLAWAREPAGVVAGRGKLAEIVRYRAVLPRYRTRSAVVAAHGTDRVTAVTVAKLDREWKVRPGTERRIEVDAVCVGFGFTPRLELAVAAGCLVRDGFVRVDERQATSVPNVYAAGEITGIGGADLARAEGEIAGTCAANGVPAPATLKAVRAGRTFAAALDRVYQIRPGWRTWLDERTLVCRCEEVDLAALRAAVEDHAALGLRSLKLTCRVGLGLCQGRVCLRNAAELAGFPYDAERFSRRPIAAPLRLGELADTPHSPTTTFADHHTADRHTADHRTPTTAPPRTGSPALEE
ncbi:MULTISPECIES: FAD/NAD(P)-binding oxidoreductase [unclassified Saccharothrix]|uniref:FAD/NAD(P)-binding oxidoreductase n=1 Tax=unclassified Saccharothrix TaxID=2593673 RepID=UPI00307DA117